MNQTDLERFRALLDEHREALRHRLTDLGADPDLGTLEATDEGGFADSAQLTAQRAGVLAEVDHLREELREVEEALARIERGVYGLCEVCGQPIEPQRLEALPATRVCISCKRKSA